MRILWIPKWFPSAEHPLNGPFFVEQIEMLRKRGHQVAVFNTNPALRSSYLTGRLAIRRDEDDPRVHRADVPVCPRPSLPGQQVLATAWARAFARRWGDAPKPEVIHAHSVLPSVLVARELSRLWHVPYGLTEHSPSTMTISKTSPRYRVIRRAVAEADFRLSVSDGVCQQFADFYAVPSFSTIPLPVAEASFATPLPQGSDTFTFVHVSLIEPRKRADRVIRALGAIAQDYPQTRAVFIGGADDVNASLTLLATECGVADRVRLLPPTDKNGIRTQFAQSDCFVLVSSEEAGGAVYGEAMAAGLPCIASATVGGSYYVTPQTGIVVPIDDHDALVHAMIDVIERRGRGDFAPEDIRAEASRRYSEQAFVNAQIGHYERAIADFRR